MLTAIVMALALFGSHKTVFHRTVRVAGWNLMVRSDTFTGGKSCKARRGDAAFQNGVVVFAFGPLVDTSGAEYRLDLGAAHSIQEVALRDRVLGAPVLLEPIDNPSRGLVILPAADVATANDVWIRTAPRAAPRRFTVAGLQGVMDQEKLLGCA